MSVQISSAITIAEVARAISPSTAFVNISLHFSYLLSSSFVRNLRKTFVSMNTFFISLRSLRRPLGNLFSHFFSNLPEMDRLFLTSLGIVICPLDVSNAIGILSSFYNSILHYIFFLTFWQQGETGRRG